MAYTHLEQESLLLPLIDHLDGLACTSYAARVFLVSNFHTDRPLDLQVQFRHLPLRIATVGVQTR